MKYPHIISLTATCTTLEIQQESVASTSVTVIVPRHFLAESEKYQNVPLRIRAQTAQMVRERYHDLRLCT